MATRAPAVGTRRASAQRTPRMPFTTRSTRASRRVASSCASTAAEAYPKSRALEAAGKSARLVVSSVYDTIARGVCACERQACVAAPRSPSHGVSRRAPRALLPCPAPGTQPAAPGWPPPQPPAWLAAARAARRPCRRTAGAGRRAAPHARNARSTSSARARSTGTQHRPPASRTRRRRGERL